ncbi:MAG: hypothetical protein A2014_12455 [Spirochaetes bacterium GWF1_49_6]|nr:MAG: hypothetical protein A2014_12455 [Spirochaetes bacterium GWF1_49_6]
MKRSGMISLIVLSGIVLSCTITPDPNDGTPVVPDSITITSPAVNAAVGVPFTINGSFTGKVVTIEVNGKAAAIVNNTWAITYTSNDMLPLGMKQFDAFGKNSFGTTLVTASRVFNITNNGSLLPGFTVSGMLTGYYSTNWKVVGILNGDPGFVYAVMNSSNYSFVVNQGDSLEFFAFLDNNPADGFFDSLYEYLLASNIIVLNAISNDISTNIDIPDISSYIVSMSLTNNSFGYPMGVFLLQPYSLMIYNSGSSTASIVNESVNVSCVSGTILYYGFYIDANQNDKFDLNLVDGTGESYSVIGYYILTNNENFHMKFNSHVISGTVSGSGAADMSIARYAWGPTYWQGNISGGSYQINFYSDAQGGANMSFYPGAVLVYHDVNGDNYFSSSIDKAVYSQNSFTITNLDGAGHTLDFNVHKYTFYYNASGDDAADFLIRLDYGSSTGGVSQAITAYKNADQTNNFIYITWDQNKDGIGQFVEPSSVLNFDLVTEPTYTMNMEYQRLLIYVTISNSAALASYNHPRFEVQGYFYDTTHPAEDCVLTNYWITNKPPNSIGYLTVYDDINNDTNHDSFSEPIINTNNPILYGNFGTTNVIVYITN